MKKILVVSLFLTSVIFTNAEELTLEKVKEIAFKVTSEFNSKLKKELKKVKRVDGIKGMTYFCINDSMRIVERLNDKYGTKVSIKRVSLNNRNEKAKVLEDEKKILEAFDLIQKADAYQPEQLVQIVDDNIYKVYFPVEMKSRDCKKCHGLEKKVDKESKKRFLEVYKNSNGYGYKSGDIRGAVVITISK